MSDYNGSNSSEPEQLRKMFLGGLSFNTTEDSIRNYFGKYGEITDCCVVRHKHGDRKPKGFGFVTFGTSAAVSKVIAAKKDKAHSLDDRDIDVKRALPKDDEGPKESTNKAFVGGLSPETTEEDLKNYFSHHGNVVEVSIPKPAEGKKRLFGFITFDDTDTVDQLIILQNHELHGRKLVVSKAMPKGDRGDRFGGRGGGRGGRGGGRDFGGGYGGRGGGRGGGGGYRSGRGGYDGDSYGGQSRYQPYGGSGGYGGGQGGYGGSGGYGGGYGGSGGYGGGSSYDQSGGYNDFGSSYGQQSSSYGPMKSGGGGGGSGSGGSSGGYGGGRNQPYSGGYGGSSGGGSGGYGGSSGGGYGGSSGGGYGGSSGGGYGGGGYGGRSGGQSY